MGYSENTEGCSLSMTDLEFSGIEMPFNILSIVL